MTWRNNSRERSFRDMNLSNFSIILGAGPDSKTKWHYFQRCSFFFFKKYPLFVGVVKSISLFLGVNDDPP